MRRYLYLYFLIGFVFFNTKLLALKDDSLKVKKQAKHYFNTLVYTDFYKTGKRDLSDINFVGKKLKTYQVSQFVVGFNTPLLTKDFYNKDSTVISNFHLLLTGGY